MRIIISPAKKMNMDTDSFPCQGVPLFLKQAKELLTVLQAMDYAALKQLWGCNDSLAARNESRVRHMRLDESLTPAVLSYEGIQYRYMAPGVLTEKQLIYIQTHLRIISGFYGLLRPFDGVAPYRLEMQAKLRVPAKLCMPGCKDLYAFWGSRLAESLAAETSLLVNLASEEYSRAILPHLPAKVRVITCVFGELYEDRVLSKGTACKMARGEMVRYMAENQVEKPEKLRNFDRLGYCFAPERSSCDTYTFLKGPEMKKRLVI